MLYDTTVQNGEGRVKGSSDISARTRAIYTRTAPTAKFIKGTGTVKRSQLDPRGSIPRPGRGRLITIRSATLQRSTNPVARAAGPRRRQEAHPGNLPGGTSSISRRLTFLGKKRIAYGRGIEACFNPRGNGGGLVVQSKKPAAFDAKASRKRE